MTVWADGTRNMPTMTSPYGYSDDYTDSNGNRIFHGGADFIDFDVNCAHEAGKVIFAGWTDFGDGGAGIEVAIQHDGWVSRLLHNDSVLVSVGDLVAEGQPVGVQGRSGYGSRSYYKKHCHDEVRLVGRYGIVTDPVPFLSRRIGTSSAGTSGKPIPVKKKPEDTTVIQIKIDDSDKKFAADRQTYFALVGEGIPWAPYTDARRANNYAAYVGKPTAISCTYSDWDYYKSIATSK